MRRLLLPPTTYNYAGTEFGALSLVCLLVQIELGGNFSLRRARNRRRCRSSQNFLFFLGNCNCAVFMKEKVPVQGARASLAMGAKSHKHYSNM